MSDFQTVVTTWWETALAVSIQFTLLAALGMGAHWLLRRRDPRLRYALWVLILGRLLLPFDLATPWGLEPTRAVAAWFGDGAPAGDAAPAREILRSVADSGNRSPTGLAAASTGERASEPGLAATELAGTWASERNARPTLQLGAFVLWVLGAACFAVLTFFRVRHARRVVKEAVHSEELSEMVRALAIESGRPAGLSPVPVRVAAEGTLTGGPLVTGPLQPSIVVPAEAVNMWPAGDLRAALLHELAHVQRGDLWILGLQQVILCLYFFHPLAWWAHRRVQAERELCCDDAVMRQLAGNEKDYLHALLKGAGVPVRRVSATLSVNDGHGSLEKRIRRITQRGYQSGAVRQWFGMAVVLMAVIFSAAFVGGRTTNGEQEGASLVSATTTPRIKAIRLYPFYFLSDQDGQFDWESGSRIGGDVVLGKVIAGQSLRDVDLQDAAAGSIEIRVRTGIDGVPVSADVLSGQDSKAAEALLAAVKTHRFEPAMHKAHGVVGLEMIYKIEIEPLVGDQPEVRHGLGNVVEVTGAVDQDNRPLTSEVTAQLPNYLTIHHKPEFEGEINPSLVGDLNFGVLVDREGEVELVEQMGATDGLRALGFETFEQTIAQVKPWVERMKLEPITLEAPAEKVLVALDLRVERGEVAVATYAPVGDDWREQLADLYSLEDQESVKLIPGPFGPARLELFRSLDPQGGRRRPEGPSGMTLGWTETGLQDRIQSNCYGSCVLLSIDQQQTQVGGGYASEGTFLRHLRQQSGLPIEVVLGAQTDSVLIGAGDMILRDGASDAALLDGFAFEVERLLNEPMVWDTGVVQRSTIVLRGRMGSLAKEPELGNVPVLHLFNDEMDPDPRSGSGFHGASDGPTLARALEQLLGTEVIDETVGPFSESFTVKLHRSASGTQFLRTVLDNIEQQSGLELALEERPTEVIEITIGR